MNKNKVKKIAIDLIKVINGNSDPMSEGEWKTKHFSYPNFRQVSN